MELEGADVAFLVFFIKPPREQPREMADLFCAVQLFRFVDFKNNAVFAPRFYEGEAAEKMSQIL